MIVERAHCKITALNRDGLGVGYTEQGTVTLPYTLPGEGVAFERHKYRHQSNCILTEITEPSPMRATPPCPYFGTCGGCLLQHLNPATYRNFKINLITQALSAQQIYTTINDLIIVPNGHRRRGSFEVVKKNNQIFLGFRRFGSHQIINIDACLVLEPTLSSLLIPLKTMLFQVLESNQKVNIFLLAAANGIDMIMERRGDCSSLTSDQESLLIAFAKDHGIIRLSIKEDGRFKTILETEKPYVTFEGDHVAAQAGDFLQASALSDQILTDLVLKYMGSIEPSSLGIDLFCGRGTFTLPLSKQCKMEGADSDHKALQGLDEAAEKNNRPITVAPRNLYQQPLLSQELSKYAFAVMNPPRAGAQAQVQQLASSAIPKVCYVSCNPETFARDARLLEQGGYILKNVTPVDQFYWTPHLEVVGFFERPVHG